MSDTSTVARTRRSSRAETMNRSIGDHVVYTLASEPSAATDRDMYMSTALAVRDQLAERWTATNRRYQREDVKRVYYLSLEFLMGRALGNAMLNLELREPVAEALLPFGYDVEDLEEMEPDAGLGNGGLGRLAACYLDSMATL